MQLMFVFGTQDLPFRERFENINAFIDIYSTQLHDFRFTVCPDKKKKKDKKVAVWI